MMLLMLFTPSLIKAQNNKGRKIESNQDLRRQNAKVIADSFINNMIDKPIEKIRSIRLTYAVHMDLEGFVKVKMMTTLEMIKEKDFYLSVFSLKEPIGKNTWSKFMLYVFGKHTADYKEMMKTIATQIHERFRLKERRFITEEFREIVPEVKVYQNQTGIKVYFDYNENLIKFWEYQTNKTFSKSMSLTNQVGPLTAFFNFLLFKPEEVEMVIVNAIKQIENSKYLVDSLRDKINIHFLFDSQTVRLQKNNTGLHTDYDHAIYFEGENYLDIIYGKNIFYEILCHTDRNIKIPYAIFLEGIISKAKKREMEEIRKRQKISPLEAETADEATRYAGLTDPLAAKDVEIYLTEAKVIF